MQTPSHSQFFLSWLLLLIAGLVLSCGCVSDTPSPAAEPADAGIRIITEELPPFNYVGADGVVTGQATDVVNGILSRLNQKATIEVLPWNEGYNAAVAGPSVALYATGRTDERENLFKWVGPVTTFDYMLYTKSDSGITLDSLEAAKKVQAIGVVKDDARHQFLLENHFTNVQTCESEAECLRNLLAGRTDLWFGSSGNAVIIAEKEKIDPSRFQAAYSVRSVDLYIAFSKDTPDDVTARWQDALDAMKRDGTFDTIRQKYGMKTAGSTSVPASAGDQADLALSTLMAATDSRLLVVLRTYEVVAVTSDAKAARWETVRPLLVVLESNEPDARTWYANPDGSYYTIIDGLTTANLMSRSYFPGVLAGDESVGTVVVSHSTGRNTAIVAVPVEENGKVTGILGASVYLDTLTDALQKEIRDPFIFYAIDKENKFALHSEKGQISRDITTIGASSSFGQALRTIQSQESGTVSYEDGGVQYQAKFRTSPLTGWRFVVAWPDVA
ncbi:MAG: ABC transporter substrate-binding protein [Methanomicrobiales archaeon HGW-Methanomicrobiales-3]|jgi:ABC-type amino acid transport substrate-binding protein|nr:MAG: ABC transporter substrate-binding protein [Methanomicrobiales archaeon HGW-Methanomicrobiales-3]